MVARRTTALSIVLILITDQIQFPRLSVANLRLDETRRANQPLKQLEKELSMGRFVLLAAFIAATAIAPARSAPPIALSPSAQKDVQCFILFATAVDDAQAANDEKVKEATSLAVMYYLGKLAVEAPGLDLVEAVRQEALAMEGNIHVKDIGAACDAEFGRVGSELISMGNQLQDPTPQSSSSS